MTVAPDDPLAESRDGPSAGGCVTLPLSGRPVEAPRVLLPGSFDPVHEGHLRIARLAAERAGAAVDFEIATRNVDKPTATTEEIHRRALGLRAAVADDPRLAHLRLTAAATFPEKARLFPGATFAVGLDTFRRLADPRYYGGPVGLDAALGTLGDLGARFLVFFRHGDAPDGWDDPGRYPPRLASSAAFIPRDDYGDEGRLASRRLRIGAGRRAGGPCTD